MRRAARTDATQDAIIDALKRCGVQVEYVKQPFDLVVYNPHTKQMAYVECKSPRPTSEGGSNGLTRSQAEFIARFGGPVHIARSPEEAVRLVLGSEVMA